ncbi:MAG: helix-turn-helix domain-containing protein [Clostridia bacterium]|nr:helix-turn-helix domain-containing protein [Clostridia bacterium]
MSRLGETIRAARVKSGMTPKALAKKCGVAESFINDVERGSRIVSDDQAQRILKVLGVKNPVSTELEVAAEPDVPLRPRPRPYVIPAKPPETVTPQEQEQTQASADAWLDALGGVVKRVPIIDENGLVIDHRLMPVIGGRIEGGHPDKVMFFRVPDNKLRGFRVFAGDLLLVVPAATPVDDSFMIIQMDGRRVARKVKKQDGGRVLLQSYEMEFDGEVLPLREVLFLGRCVRLERAL